MAKLYTGTRHQGKVLVTVHIAGEPVRELRHVHFHSDGLEWGYAGSGPADLALSILADHFDEHPTQGGLLRDAPRAWEAHQDFKWMVVTKFAKDGWALTSAQIERWLQARQEGGEKKSS